MVSEPTENGATLQRWVKPLLQVMAVVVFFCLVTVAVLAMQVRSVNRQLDDVNDATTDIQSFVIELRAERSANEVGDTQLQRVFAAVFDTLQILCRHYPDDPECLQG